MSTTHYQSSELFVSQCCGAHTDGAVVLEVVDHSGLITKVVVPEGAKRQLLTVELLNSRRDLAPAAAAAAAHPDNDDCPHGRWKGETCLECLSGEAGKMLGAAMAQNRDDRIHIAASHIYARSLMAKPTALGSVEWVMMEPALAAKAARRLVDAVALELLEQGLKT